jgi:mannose-6-phosphate isomerase-like protein (cupin superfamily)
MAFTRRELCVLLPALMATATGYSAEKHENNNETLPSTIYDFKHLPVKGDKHHSFFPIFEGNASSGMHVEMHETALAPGAVVHEMIKHPGDELFLVREGTLEVEFNGKRSQVGPGSVAYVASNTEYAIRNTSKEWTRYFVFLLGLAHS